jgi:hypothetical protein
MDAEDKMKFIGKALKKAGELLEDKPSEKTLLTEYQVCQQESDNISSQYWISISVITGINLILLAGIIHGAIAGYGTLHENRLWLLLGLLVSSFTSWLLFCMLKRSRYLNQLCFHRMREIENILGMWKNRTVDYIDNFHESKQKRYANEPDRQWWNLSVEDTSRLQRIKERYKPPKPGFKSEKYLYLLYIAPWIVLLIIAFIIDC